MVTKSSDSRWPDYFGLVFVDKGFPRPGTARTRPDDFAAFAESDVLVGRATSPAWTPLSARAAAVVTDGGTLAAHGHLVAREYSIPA
jgi:phosphoenolpyruvate synthase/pyruvate phosphate dikinase